MKKISMILAALMLLTLSLNAQTIATKGGVAVQPNMGGSMKAPNRVDRATATLTVCNGTSTNSQVPLYGTYFDDNYQISQMIYPESMLTNMIGGNIKSVTFYSSDASNLSSLSGGKFDISVGMTTTSQYGSTPSRITSGMVLVASNKVVSNCVSGANLVINFDTEFTYTGGNLVIEYHSTQLGSTYKGVSFYGYNQNNGITQYASYNARSTSTSSPTGGSRQRFLPRATFTYEEQAAHDLSIALDAPAKVGVGNTVTLTATVTNTGNFTESGYTVTFRDGNNNVIDTQTGGSLAAGASATFTTTYTTTAAQGGQTVNFTATVACTGDEDATNNSATASTSVMTLPPPENVAAMADDVQSATMTWDAPNIAAPESLEWGFESQSQANQWTLVNADGDSYNWEYFSYSSGSVDQFIPHTGTGAMRSASYINDVGAITPNNWLISPEVTLGGTFTFWAKGTDTNDFAENFGVFVHEGSYSGGTSGFVQVGADATTTDSWRQYSFNLSQFEGTGHIAIRHYNCSNMYWLMVDDVNYLVQGDEQPVSYNIYLDGVLVGNVNSNVFSYTFNNLTSGQHNCGVSAVYTFGESAIVTVPIPEFAPITSGTVSPTSVNFGTKDLGGTYTATVTVTNTGNQPFTPVINTDNLPGVFTVTGAQQVSAHGTLNLTVTFTPTEETNYSGSFTVTIPVPDGDDIVVTVTVTGASHNVSLLSSNTTEVIPVYKSDIEMGAPYTKDQVDDDDMMMELTPNIATGTLNVKVKNESAIKRYEINRGLPSNWSVVAIAGHQGNYFTPYDGDGVTAQGDAVDVSSTGTDYTWVTVQDNTAAPSGTAYYVPVTVADGKVRTGNTYGAKRLPITVAMGSVSATVEVDQGGENEGSTWEINGVEYCVYIPVFEIAGTLPNVTVDGVTYEPYMFRAWRKGSGAYEVTRDYNDPLKPLKEGEPLGPVSLLAQRTNVNSTSVIIGDQYDEESPDNKPETAFAAPYVQDPDISFVVRFYYKRVIDNGESPAGMRRSPVEEGEYYIAEYELEDTDVSIVTAINELFNGRVAVETTYVNALGQQSSQPFDGVNIVITRYNDGTVTTSKVLK